MKRQAPLRDISILFGLFLAISLCSGRASAQKFGEIMLQPQLVAETNTPKAGESVQTAIRMTPKPGWHGYWKNSGSPSLKDVFEWDLPKGFSIGPLQYPVPKKKTLLGVTSHVFEGEYALLTELQLPKDFVAPAVITLRARYLACSETVCLPQKTSISLRLTPNNQRNGATNTPQFDAWRAKLPQVSINAKAVSIDPDTLQIEFPNQAPIDIEKAWFFADDAEQFDASAKQEFAQKDGVVSAIIKRKPNAVFQNIVGVFDFGAGQSAIITAPIQSENTLRNWIGWLAGLSVFLGLGLVLIFRGKFRRSAP